MRRKYNWRPDLSDIRDLKFTFEHEHAKLLPPAIDLAGKMSPIENQFDLGSCTANALAGCVEYLIRQRDKAFNASRLFIYWNERFMEGTINQDAGAILRDGIKSLAKWGVCDEKQWPYIVNQFRKQPPQACYDAALKNRIVKYQSLTNLNSMKAVLAQGLPFAFGFTVYSSLETAAVERTGIVPMPTARDSVLGGHAVCAVGYDDSTKLVKFRNSWGPDWGRGGHGFLPYDYIASDSRHASDFWVVNA